MVAYVGLNKLALYSIVWSKMSWILYRIAFFQLLIQNNSPALEVCTLDMAQLQFVAPYFNIGTLNLLYFPPHHLLDLQLKPRHQPYKLCRQWQDLLYRFTDASEEDISQGERRDFVGAIEK